MIRFACPRCRAILERAESAAGTSFDCPSCGQHLVVPQPAGGEPGSTSRPTSADPPESGAAAVPAPPPPMPYVTTYPEAAAPAPKQRNPWDSRDSSRSEPSERRTSRSSRDDDSRDLDVSRRRRRRPDYEEEDDYDDDFLARRTGSRFSREVAAKAATSGFLCSMGGMLLFVISLVMFMVATRQGRPMGGQVNPMFFVITLMTVGSFILGLMGTIFSSRGLDQNNDYNRGMGVAGLVVGIIDLVLASIGGIFLLCLGLIFFSMPM